MSYLSIPTSKTEYGVVQVGDYINVLDGIISLEQDLSSNANVTFNNSTFTGNVAVAGNVTGNGLSFINGSFTGNVNVAGNLTAAGNLVLTDVTPSAGNGIAISNLVPGGYHASFTVENTGVLSLTAGSGITLTGNTGHITISSYGADLINVYGTTTSYTASVTDEYIGVYSAAAVTITLPAGINGRVYTIKDEYGQGSGKITIQPASGQLIDGKVNYIISVPNQSVSVVFRATGWWII